MSSPRSADERRRRSGSFGAHAAQYDRLRPGYPPEALARIAEAPADVLDLGTGTGILAAALAGHGHRVVGVEPDEAMRDIAMQRLAGPVLAGYAERIPLPDAAIDAVVVGQAWHWFEPAAAAAEIARVLRPGGRLTILWNVRDERDPWMAELGRIVGGSDRLVPGEAPRIPQLGPPFGEVGVEQIAHRHVLGRTDLRHLASTWSYVATRSDVAAVLDSVDALASRCARDVAMSYVCVVVRARRDD